MRFLVDAQLPKQLAVLLVELGHDTRHTLGLPKGNATTDDEISVVAVRENRIVITKDADFIDSHLIHGKPLRLLLVSTGNISNRDLIDLFKSHHEPIVSALESSSFAEMTPTGLIIHE